MRQAGSRVTSGESHRGHRMAPSGRRVQHSRHRGLHQRKAALYPGVVRRGAISMTEEEWLGCTDPGAMLEALRARGGTSERKLRLFAVAACSRRYREQLRASQPGPRAVEVAERLADGPAPEAEVERAERDVTDYAASFLAAVFGTTADFEAN